MKKLFVCLFAVSMAFVLVGSAMAAGDWSFYGSARTGTWWLSSSDETRAVYSSEALSGTERGESDFSLSHALQGNARIGAKVTSGDVSGQFEYGASGGKANIRILKGVWDFGAGQLTVGQDYTPISWTNYSNQVLMGDEGMLGFGAMYGGRKGLLQLQYGGFKVALVEPNVVSAVTDASGAVYAVVAGTQGVAVDANAVLPKVEVAYHYAGDNFFADIGAGFQATDYKFYFAEAGVSGPSERDATITSWVVGAGAGYNFGKGYYAKLQLNYDVNGAAYGLARYAPSSVVSFSGESGGFNAAPYSTRLTGTPTSEALGFEDAQRFGAVFTVGGTLNDIVGVEAGAGIQRFSNDYFLESENTVYAAYLQVPFTVANGVSITPEVGYINWGDIDASSPVGQKKSEIDAGSSVYFGLSSKIHF